MLDLRYLGGKREFFATEDDAVTARRAALDTAKQHGAAALSLSHQDRIAFCLARDRLAKIGLTIDQAVAFTEKHHEWLDPVPFSEAIEKLVAVKAATDKAPEYVRKLKSNIESLQAFCSKELIQVTRDDIEAWLYGNAWSPATIRNKRIDVQTFFRFAMARRWIVTNPADKLEPVELPDAPPGILTVDQCSALMRATWPEVRAIVALNLFCGLRPEECVQIAPEMLQLARGYVEVPAAVAKSKRRRLVDISSNAKQWLKTAAALQPRSPKWYARQLPSLREAASKFLGRPMPWPKNCLRHSFASYHLAMHGSAEKTALQMGHRSTDMLFRHYRELVTKEDALQFWAIDPGNCE